MLLRTAAGADISALTARIDLALLDGAPDAAARARCEAAAKDLERSPRPDAAPQAILIRAGLAATGGDRPRAIELLGRAVVVFERMSMHLWASCARLQRARLEGDVVELQRAEQWMLGHGVSAPRQWADFVAPGYRASAA